MSWLSFLHREATGLLDLLLPESCPVCDHPAVLQPEGLCCECLKQIVPLPASHCPRCIACLYLLRFIVGCPIKSNGPIGG
jgi:hypothetical protein